MEAVLSDFPLALFTTLASLGAGAFLALAVVFCTCTFGDVRLGRIDKMCAVPLVVAIVGFCCTFAHVASPLKAYGIFAGVGSSPLSNEVVAGAVFLVAACIYFACGLAGKLGAARKPLAFVVAVLAVVFAVFMGLAYAVPTISSWNTGLNAVEMLGYLLAGGAAVAVLVLALAGAGEKDDAGEGGARAPFGKPLLVLAAAGAAIATIAGTAHLVMVAGDANAVASGASVAAGAAPCFIVGMVFCWGAVLETARALKRGVKTAAGVRIAVEMGLGILLARLSFYSLYLSVGVTLM